MQGNACIYRVPFVAAITVDVRCPPNSIKDTLRNVCVYEPQPLNLQVQCPPNTQRSGDFCIMEAIPIQFRCSDGSMPIDNVCTVTPPRGIVTVRCPQGSRDLGNNMCEMIPPEVRYLCPGKRNIFIIF